MTRRLLHNDFYMTEDSKYNEETETYFYKVLYVFGDRMFENSKSYTIVDYGHVEDTPENRELVVKLLTELEAAEAERTLEDNEADYADTVGKSFRQIAEDFWQQHEQDLESVFSVVDPEPWKTKGINYSVEWILSENGMLERTNTDPDWHYFPRKDWRKLPRKPGAGRKPVAPGGVKPVTVTLSDADKAALKGIDQNMSEAVRKLIAQNAAAAE